MKMLRELTMLMEPFQPSSIWLDVLPIALQSRLVLHVTGGELNEQAAILAKLSYKWAELVWSAAQHVTSVKLCLERKTDEELETLQQLGKRAREAHYKLLTLIKCFAEWRANNFRGLCFQHPEIASQVLSGMKVTSAHIPCQMNLINNVLASSVIEELHLTVHDSTMQQMPEEIASVFRSLASLSLKRLYVDGQSAYCYSNMDILTTLASGFAVFVSEGSSCHLIWSVRPPLYDFYSSANIRGNYWRSIELLPAATILILFYPPPERLLAKLGSFAALIVRTQQLSSRAVGQLGRAMEICKGEFRTCIFSPRQGSADLRSLLDCTRLKMLHAVGCWHLLAELAPVVNRMRSLLRLKLSITAKNNRGVRCNVCEEDPNYLPLTSQFFQSIAHIEKVDFVGRDLTHPDSKQVLKLLGTKLHRLRLLAEFESRKHVMDYVEVLLIDLLEHNSNIHNIATRFFWDPTNECELSLGQERRIRILADKLDQRQPLLQYENYITKLFSSFGNLVGDFEEGDLAFV